MSLLVVGTVAFDTLQTPLGRAERVLGGSATHFAHAASYFGAVRLVSAVGGDFPAEHVQAFTSRGVDVTGLRIVPDALTMHWSGAYASEFGEASTVAFEENVLADQETVLPEAYLDSEFVFLANDMPQRQLAVLEAVRGTPFAVLDTREVWIEREPEALREVLLAVDGLVLNDYEARLLSEERNLVRAGPRLRDMGPRFVIIKKGEHGSILFAEEGVFALPACPLEVVRDPTGAGDAFAGGLMGYLAAAGKRSPEAVRRGMTHATVAASIAVEDMGTAPYARVDKAAFDARHDAFLQQIRI